MAQKFRDFMISGLAVLPAMLWALTGSVECFAVTAFFMLLATITVSMALPPSADTPVEPKNRSRRDS